MGPRVALQRCAMPIERSPPEVPMKPRAASLLMVLVAALQFPIASTAFADLTFPFSDNTFNNGDWSLTILVNRGGGAVMTGSQNGSGGNPGAYRNVTDQLNAPPSGDYTAIVGLHLMNGAVYTPSAQGAITSIDCSLDFEMYAPGFSGAQMGFGPALRQGGVAYSAYAASGNASWLTFAMPGLVQSSFVAADGVSNPDFSLAGGPIELGFETSNSTCVSCSGYSNGAGFDNWSMVVHTPGLAGVPPGIPAALSLRAEPSPATGPLTVEFGLPRPERASVAVYDLQGRLVARLADDSYAAGPHTTTWDRRATSGSGAYFVVLRAGDATRRQLVVALR